MKLISLITFVFAFFLITSPLISASFFRNTSETEGGADAAGADSTEADAEGENIDDANATCKTRCQPVFNRESCSRVCCSGECFTEPRICGYASRYCR